MKASYKHDAPLGMQILSMTEEMAEETQKRQNRRAFTDEAGKKAQDPQKRRAVAAAAPIQNVEMN